MAEVKWIKIVTDMFDNRKIKQIEMMPDADAILVIWLKILCLAGLVNECGAIMFTPDIPYTDEMLAHEFNRPINTVRMALNMFERFGMIEIVDSVYMVTNWEKYQNIDGLEKIREQTRLRNIDYRARKRAELPERDVTHDAGVTQCDATDIDIDKEEDIDIPPYNPPLGDVTTEAAPQETEKPKRRKRKQPEYIDDETASVRIRQWTTSQAMHDAVMEFVAFRREGREPMTMTALIKALNVLERKGADEEERIEMINQSILAGYRGVFPLSGNNKQTKPSGLQPPAYQEWN